MAKVHQSIILLLILQIYASAAPSNTDKPDDAIKAENGTLKLDDIPSPIEESKADGKTPDNQRQKRFYNHYGYGFPPINPIQYPTHNKRDQSSDLGLFGIDDPLSQIHRRLQDIASFARQPALPPPPPIPNHFPFFFPVIFVPQHCACAPNYNTPNITPTAKPDTTQPATKPPADAGTTTPDVFNRWPEMEDERQNWGLVVNETDYDVIDDDFTRPISFDPIVVNTSMSRPAPPVEHGSSQGGAGVSTTTARPSNDIPRPPKEPRPPAAVGSAFAGALPSNSVENPREAPSTCDGAVLSCCHQPQVTYDCFAVLGCPDPTSYGNPCAPSVILNVIAKYQEFYGVRKG